MSHDSQPKSPPWPAQTLRLKLLELNKRYMQNHSNPLLRDRETWPNHQPELYAEELAIAQSLNVTPISPDDPLFADLMTSGLRFNWAVLPSGELRVTPSVISSDSGPARISHAVLSPDGGPVLAVGEGKHLGFLSNTTGHYKNEPFVIAPVKAAFAEIGIIFKR